jgi:hypothetical protein
MADGCGTEAIGDRPCRVFRGTTQDDIAVHAEEHCSSSRTYKVISVAHQRVGEFNFLEPPSSHLLSDGRVRAKIIQSTGDGSWLKWLERSWSPPPWHIKHCDVCCDVCCARAAACTARGKWTENHAPSFPMAQAECMGQSYAEAGTGPSEVVFIISSRLSCSGTVAEGKRGLRPRVTCLSSGRRPAGPFLGIHHLHRSTCRPSICTTSCSIQVIASSPCPILSLSTQTTHPDSQVRRYCQPRLWQCRLQLDIASPRRFRGTKTADRASPSVSYLRWHRMLSGHR